MRQDERNIASRLEARNLIVFSLFLAELLLIVVCTLLDYMPILVSVLFVIISLGIIVTCLAQERRIRDDYEAELRARYESRLLHSLQSQLRAFRRLEREVFLDPSVGSAAIKAMRFIKEVERLGRIAEIAGAERSGTDSRLAVPFRPKIKKTWLFTYKMAGLEKTGKTVLAKYRPGARCFRPMGVSIVGHALRNEFVKIQLSLDNIKASKPATPQCWPHPTMLRPGIRSFPLAEP